MPTLADVFRLYGPAYLEKYRDKMSVDQCRAMRAILHCRTPELGTTVYRCKSCERLHAVHRPCGNRHCPNCQGNKAREWKRKALAQLLPCSYFMVTFTVPEALRAFIRSHPKECYRALLHSSLDALVKLAKDPKFVGSERIGATAVLHTWGRDLSWNPHVHVLVPGGAISKDRKDWLPSRSDFFVPIWALSPIFRAKFRSCMTKAGLLSQIDPKVWKIPWNVNSKAVGDGRRAVQYLAPYIFRVALTNRRIAALSDGKDGKGEVTLMVRPSKSLRYRPMRFSAEEFIRRFLQHVLPRGFQKVRHVGFSHPRAKTDWEWLKMMVTTTLNQVYTLTVMAKPIEEPSPMLCSECGGELEYWRTVDMSIDEPMRRLLENLNTS